MNFYCFLIRPKNYLKFIFVFLFIPIQIFSFNVRVLLDERSNLNGSWQISSTKGFVLTGPNSKRKFIFNKKNIDVMSLNGFFYINGKRYPCNQLKISPLKGNLSFNGKEYQGFFVICYGKINAYFINCIELEDYIYSVLRFESWPGWPLEVNKALAVACRTYVIAKVLESRIRKKNYHIKDTNAHQTYNGVHDLLYFKKAVKRTKGTFISYKKKPIVAMFDSCCGGIIPKNMEGVDFKGSPYLERAKECKYCKGYKIFNWKLKYRRSELESIFSKKFKNLGKLKDIKIVRKDKAGIVREVAIIGSHSTFSLTGKETYSLIKEIKSFCFSISEDGNYFIIAGQGYGHHLGLCQWGARKMFDEGYDYKRILKFYYPGTEFMKLKKNKVL